MLVLPIVAIMLAVFVLPQPWGVVLVVSVILWEVGEKAFWWRYTRRLPVVVGRESLIGLPVTALSACRPYGRVRLNGESWNAHCLSGAGSGETLVVERVDALTLIVGRPGA